MTDAEKRAFNAGVEAAACVADPIYAKRRPGQWVRLRMDIAAKIRACKMKSGAP